MIKVDGTLEYRLIKTILRYRLLAEEIEFLKENIIKPLDWNAIFIFNLWHKTLFLFLERLKSYKLINLALTKGTLPLILLNHWKQLHETNYQRNLMYIDELKNVSQLLLRKGVNYAVAKGGVLLFDRIYSYHERKIYDVDLIASKNDLTALEECFKILDYNHYIFNHDTDEFTLLPREEVRKWILHTRGLPNFIKPVSSPFMEYFIFQVQFKIGTTVDKEHLLSAETFLHASINYSSYKAVRDIDLLIQLILHIYRETVEESFADWNMNWNLIKFCDLDYFINYFDKLGSWQKFYERVRELNLQKQCIYSINYTNDIFPCLLKGELLTHLTREGPSFGEHLANLRNNNANNKVCNLGSNLGDPKSAWSSLMPAKTT